MSRNVCKIYKTDQKTVFCSFAVKQSCDGSIFLEFILDKFSIK